MMNKKKLLSSTKIAIINCLFDNGPSTPGMISEKTNLSRVTIMKQLGELEEYDVVLAKTRLPPKNTSEDNQNEDQKQQGKNEIMHYRAKDNIPKKTRGPVRVYYLNLKKFKSE